MLKMSIVILQKLRLIATLFRAFFKRSLQMLAGQIIFFNLAFSLYCVIFPDFLQVWTSIQFASFQKGNSSKQQQLLGSNCYCELVENYTNVAKPDPTFTLLQPGFKLEKLFSAFESFSTPSIQWPSGIARRGSRSAVFYAHRKSICYFSVLVHILCCLFFWQDSSFQEEHQVSAACSPFCYGPCLHTSWLQNQFYPRHCVDTQSCSSCLSYMLLLGSQVVLKSLP